MSVNILSRDLLEGAHNTSNGFKIKSLQIASNRFKSLQIVSNRFESLQIRSESLSKAAKNGRRLPESLKSVPKKAILFQHLEGKPPTFNINI